MEEDVGEGEARSSPRGSHGLGKQVEARTEETQWKVDGSQIVVWVARMIPLFVFCKAYRTSEL